MASNVVEVGDGGTIALPDEFRQRHGVEKGDLLAAVELEEGLLLLKPSEMTVSQLADQMAKMLEESGITLDEMLDELDRQREIYNREHYGLG